MASDKTERLLNLHIMLLVARVVTYFIQDAAFSTQTYVERLLWTKFPIYLNQRLLMHLSHLDIERFEEPAFRDRLEQVKETMDHRPQSLITGVLFAFQNVPLPRLEAQGLTLSRYEFEETTARLDLELDLQEMDDGVVGWIGYNADLFDSATIERMTAHYHRLLERVAEAPDERVWDLPLLTAAERHQVAVEWSLGAPAAPRCLPSPPAIAPSTMNGSAPAATAGGSRVSWASCERSEPQA